MRIATVKATGERYLVQRIGDIGTPKARVFTWGEVVSFQTGRGNTDAERFATKASTKHGPSKEFAMDAVTLEEIEVTGHVARSLISQMTRNTGLAVRTRRGR